MDPSVHGNGPVQVSVPGFPLPIDNIVVSASNELGGRFVFNEDFNRGNFVGVGKDINFSFVQIHLTEIFQRFHAIRHW